MAGQKVNISKKKLHPFFSLLPLLLFLSIFVVFGVQTADGDHLSLSPTVAILPAIFLAFLWEPRMFNDNLGIFMRGVGQHSILIMCFVFLLSGAFSSVMSSIDGITSTVNFALYYIPDGFILPGIFVVSAFISLAMGTSMGTVAAVTPIAVGISDASGINLLISVGAVISGAMFGDNLSIISDTTIAAVQTQGCEMRDKFRMNFFIAVPAMLLTVIVLWMYPQATSMQATGDFNFIKVIPYLLVLALSLMGMHVYLILIVGTVLGGAIGLMSPDYGFIEYSKAVYKGFTVMEEILILSMFIGGLSELIKHQGGINYLIEKTLKLARKFNKNGKPNVVVGELAISSMSSIADICTANNTVSILMAGDASKSIAKEYGIPATRTASLLDIFACVFQGLIPYSAQILLAASISGIGPIDIVGHVHYCYFLAVATLISIFFGLKRS